MAFLGWVYARANRVEDAKKVLRELKERDQKMHVPAVVFAVVYHGLGKVDEAFAFLEKGVDEDPMTALIVLGHPVIDSLCSHPRYKALLRKMNLEP